MLQKPTRLLSGICAVALFAPAVLAANCPPDDLLTLQPAGDKPLVIRHQAGTQTKYNRAFINLNVQLPNEKSRISKLKASGGVSASGKFYPVQHGTCYPSITNSPDGWGHTPYPLGFSCQLLFEANPIANGDLEGPGIYKGAIAVTYDYWLSPPPNTPACAGSGTRQVDVVVEVTAKPKAAPPPPPAPIPDVKLSLIDFKPNPKGTQVGQSDIIWFSSRLEIPFAPASSDYQHFHDRYQVWNSLRLEPDADAGNFEMDQAADGFAARGIGLKNSAPSERPYSGGSSGSVGLKITFRPIVAKLFKMRFVLDYRTCVKNDLHKCGEKKSFVLPFEVDSRTERERNRIIQTYDTESAKDKKLVLPPSVPKPPGAARSP